MCVRAQVEGDRRISLHIDLLINIVYLPVSSTIHARVTYIQFKQIKP